MMNGDQAFVGKVNAIAPAGIGDLAIAFLLRPRSSCADKIRQNTLVSGGWLAEVVNRGGDTVSIQKFSI